jgi:hypothetical protein
MLPNSLVNRMKWSPLSVASVLLAVLLPGCRPERRQTTSINPRTMAFAQAGVSLVVGEEWQCHNVNADHSLYPPSLVSQAGKIRVLLLPPDQSDPALVADVLRAGFDLNPHAAKHSFRRQQFASDNGVQGLCVSYLQQANGGASIVENSHYLVRNRAGRCVVINYVASAEDVDASAIRRMLQTSLRLQ